MSSQGPVARRLTAPTAQERSQITELFEKALVNDNAIMCLTGASKANERVLYDICMNACLKNGEVWVAGFDDQIQAASFWIQPGVDFHIGLSDDYVRRLEDGVKHWVTHHFTPKYDELYQSSYPNGKQARAQAWHLILIGVQPAFQRKGLGKLLVNVVRETASLSIITSSKKQTFQHMFFRQIAGPNV